MSRLSDINEFISTARAATSADDLRALMEPMTREMGFHSYALFQHVRHFSWKKKKLLAISNYPRDWLDYFFEHKLTTDDPIHIASHRTGVGFTFDQIPSLIPVTRRQQDILEGSRKAGITDGFCVPAHVPGETNGTCTFVVTDGVGLPMENLPMAQLVGCFAYEAARQLLLAGEGLVQCPRSERLTSRQLECIVLVARGKTDWEIATVLGIHEDTVTEHLDEARRRCGVSRRTELPIHALYNGDLAFSDILH